MSKLEHLRSYDVILIYENTSTDSVVDASKDIPSDTHIVTYTDDEGNTKLDAVRSYKMSDIFDGYYDLGIRTIQSIESGFGSIRPNLYNPNPDKKDKKK